MEKYRDMYESWENGNKNYVVDLFLEMNPTDQYYFLDFIRNTKEEARILRMILIDRLTN